MELSRNEVPNGSQGLDGWDGNTWSRPGLQGNSVGLVQEALDRCCSACGWEGKEPSSSPDCWKRPKSSLGHNFAFSSHCLWAVPATEVGCRRVFCWLYRLFPHSPSTLGAWLLIAHNLAAYWFGLWKHHSSNWSCSWCQGMLGKSLHLFSQHLQTLNWTGRRGTLLHGPFSECLGDRLKPQQAAFLCQEDFFIC